MQTRKQQIKVVEQIQLQQLQKQQTNTSQQMQLDHHRPTILAASERSGNAGSTPSSQKVLFQM